MKETKTILKFIMDFILALSVTVFLLIHILSKTILSESYILNTFNNKGYYDNVYELVESNFENYIQQSGLNEDVLKNIVTIEMIEKDTKTIISNIYDGFTDEVSTEQLEKQLENNIKKSLKNRSLSAEETKAIKEYISKISKEYRDTISNFQIENQIYSHFKSIKKYTNIGKTTAVLVMGCSIIAILLLNLKKLYRVFSNIGISSFASGSILTIIYIYINTKVKVQNLSILNDAISDIIQDIAQSILGDIIKYGALLLIAGIILIAIPTVIHNYSNYKKKIKKSEDSF